MSFSDIIGVLSLIATIAVSFAIYWLQLRHEKEIRKITELKECEELKEKAKLFLMDHEEERDYLPWCVIAANIHRLERHTRDIYTAFCRCSEELRNEILKQAGLEITSIEGCSWVGDCIGKLKNDIKKYNLGQDYLYEGAKYFRRSYENYRELIWNDTPYIFEPIYKENKFRNVFNMGKLNIGSYIDEYFYYFIDKHVDLESEKPIPPMDYVWNSQNLSYVEEKTVCMWIMELIQNIAIVIYNRSSSIKQCEEILEYTDAQTETFEDKYYATLQALYNAYYEKPINKKKSRKKFRRSEQNAKF